MQDIQNLEKHFTHPPSKWVILDNVNSKKNINKTIRDVWPEPIHSMNFSNERTISIQPVFPFADTTRAIQFSFNSIDILILNNIPEHIDTGMSSIFREKYSIIININPHRNEKIQQIRKLFRPLFLIILPFTAEDMLKNENNNSILSVTKKSTYFFYKDKKGIVQLK